MIVFKSRCCVGNIQLDLEQLGSWPVRWRCKECGNPTKLLMVQESAHLILDKGYVQEVQK